MSEITNRKEVCRLILFWNANVVPQEGIVHLSERISTCVTNSCSVLLAIWVLTSSSILEICFPYFRWNTVMTIVWSLHFLSWSLRAIDSCQKRLPKSNYYQANYLPISYWGAHKNIQVKYKSNETEVFFLNFYWNYWKFKFVCKVNRAISNLDLIMYKWPNVAILNFVFFFITNIEANGLNV